MTSLAERPTETVIAPLRPTETVSIATDIANALSDVVEQQELYTEIGKKKHLNAEAWETVIALDMAEPIIEWTKPIEVNGEVVAYKARATIVKNGTVVAAGEMICGLEEFPCQGKKGFGKHRAGMSAAQTWAVAKAARTKYAWVVTLAGYAPTPSEEMVSQKQGERAASQQQRQSDGVDPNSPLYCVEHDLMFRKTSRGHYAHIIDNGPDWHNLPKDWTPEYQPRTQTAQKEAPHPAERGSF